MVQESDKPQTVWASVGATVNTGDFNSVRIDLGVSGVPVGASHEEIVGRMALAEQTLSEVFELLSGQLIEKATALRQRDADTH